MSEALAKQIRDMPSCREPAYRPATTIDDAEKARLAEKLGAAENYDIGMLRAMVVEDPDNVELRKALVSGIVSAEYAGIDAFSRKVCEWQTWPVPWQLITAMARQTWDEVRHAQLATGLIESYGGHIGEYPDTLAGSQPTAANEAARGQMGPNGMNDPLISLSVTNVSLEGAALALFQGTSELGGKVGDELMEFVFDYNWADEVTHTAIGDYFVAELSKDDPDEEMRALKAHAMFEGMRAQLSGQQVNEIKEFFAEETERGTAALAGSGE